MWLKKFGLGLALVFGFLAASSGVGAQTPPTVDDVASRLVCQCGCTAVLTACPHIECGWGIPAKAAIAQRLSQGWSPDQIVQSFVRQYGDVVLAEPPKKGFNLMAWLLPFAAIIVGMIVIAVAIREWTRRGREGPAAAEAPVAHGDEEYVRRLENDLNDFQDGGFR